MKTLVNKGLVKQKRQGRRPALHYATSAGFRLGQAFAEKMGLELWYGSLSSDGEASASEQDSAPRPLASRPVLASSGNATHEVVRPVDTASKASVLGRKAAMGDFAKEYRVPVKPPEPAAADRRPFGFWYLDESKSSGS
jgi:hypothetical protein